MILRPTPVSSDLFTRTDIREFVAELSDLPNGLGRVYDDACDVGLTMISAKTGCEVVFAVEEEHRDGEGELQWFDLRPVSRRHRDLGLTVRLYND